MIARMLEDAGIEPGPARRDRNGRLQAREVRRLRAMLDLGLENIDIAREMALDRSAAMYHRRAYDRELADGGRPPTSPIREGRIDGRALPGKQLERLRALLASGVPASRAALTLEVSRPCATRHRARIVVDLASRGIRIPGCGPDGRPTDRRSPNAIQPDVIADIERRLAIPERIPAIAVATGTSPPTVRRIWKQLQERLDVIPQCPCGKTAHHAQRCRPGRDPRLDGKAIRTLVETSVPRHHAPALRADIVQDVIAEILATPGMARDIGATVKKAISTNYKRYADRWGTVSLDAPIGGDGTGTLLDVLAARPTP